MMERKAHQLSLFQEKKEEVESQIGVPSKKMPTSSFSNNPETIEDDKEYIISWVLERCISKYFEMSLRAHSKSLPSLTSRISDIPSSRSNEFFSKTEAAAIERVSAAEWLRIFHANLRNLPVAHKEIIEQKYLQRASDGGYKSDLMVYRELNVGRTVYYRMKKEALYWLGVMLMEEKIFKNTEAVLEGD